jgi:hypothetical protein
VWQKSTGTLLLLHSKTSYLALLKNIRQACKSFPGINILVAGESVVKKGFYDFDTWDHFYKALGSHPLKELVLFHIFGPRSEFKS